MIKIGNTFIGDGTIYRVEMWEGSIVVAVGDHVFSGTEANALISYLDSVAVDVVERHDARKKLEECRRKADEEGIPR